MKLESLVIVNHNVTVNLYLDLVHTARHMPGVKPFGFDQMDFGISPVMCLT